MNDTLDNIKDRLKYFDPEDVVAFLGLESEEIVEKFHDRIDQEELYWITETEPYWETD